MEGLIHGKMMGVDHYIEESIKVDTDFMPSTFPGEDRHEKSIPDQDEINMGGKRGLHEGMNSSGVYYSKDVATRRSSDVTIVQWRPQKSYFMLSMKEEGTLLFIMGEKAMRKLSKPCQHSMIVKFLGKDVGYNII